QLTVSTTYNFRDSSVFPNSGTPNTNVTSTIGDGGNIVLGGLYRWHGTTYGLNLKVSQTITINVSGSCTVRFTGSKHSSLHVKGTADTDGDLGTIDGDLASDGNTFDFSYTGGAKILTFITINESGSDT
ncbi:hypothetical protein IU405_09380, partial [Polaribacter sp. BAL334]|uniref:hypothetical protein n=1 Tax=Polaribacter sp. BAL334 TaxID=1708178 RepID=UPI0018D23A6E